MQRRPTPPCYAPLIRADALNGKHPALRGRNSPLACVQGGRLGLPGKRPFRVLESKCERFLIFSIKFIILHINYKRLYIILCVIQYSYKKLYKKATATKGGKRAMLSLFSFQAAPEAQYLGASGRGIEGSEYSEPEPSLSLRKRGARQGASVRAPSLRRRRLPFCLQRRAVRRNLAAPSRPVGACLFPKFFFFL